MCSCLFQSIDWDSIQWDKLTPEEKWRLEHMRLHEKHRGHESMHAEMILILFATLVISQIALVKWKQMYPHTYHVSCSFLYCSPCSLHTVWNLSFFCPKIQLLEKYFEKKIYFLEWRIQECLPIKAQKFKNVEN